MRALVMAAGLGTRLKPLTDHTPKPLVPVRGRPMVAYVLDHLARNGFTEAMINAHHLPDQMKEFVRQWNSTGGALRLFLQDESSQLLDSGGSVAQAAPWLFASEDTALVCNGDLLASPDLREMEREHRRLRQRFGVECTLSLVQNEEVGRKYNGVALGADGCISAFVEKNGQPNPSLLHFFGYYFIDRQAVARLPAAGLPASVKERVWMPLAAEGKLGGWLYKGRYLDLGTAGDVDAANRMAELP